MTILDHIRSGSAAPAWCLPVAILPLAAAVMLAAVGAFGSYAAMGLPLRLLHFSATSFAIGALAFALSACLRRYVFGGVWPFWSTVLVAAATAPLGATIVLQSLRLCAPQTLRYVSFGELSAQVLMINLLIGATTWVLLRQHNERAVSSSNDSPLAEPNDISREFRGKLPISLRAAAVIALSAEDHYVRVRTDRGQALILMKLADAILALGPDAGVRIHRSHWVTRASAAKCDSLQNIRVDADTVLPISRTGRKLVNDLRKQSV